MVIKEKNYIWVPEEANVSRLSGFYSQIRSGLNSDLDDGLATFQIKEDDFGSTKGPLWITLNLWGKKEEKEKKISKRIYDGKR